MPLEIVDPFREGAFARTQTGLLFNLPVPAAEIEQLPAGLSLCMIVKNEERFLAECLASVSGCVDEINIVDTGSTDRTIEIARSFGANVIEREWRNDFSWAKNQALDMATRRWTLVLDADEEIAREAVPTLRALGATPADTTAVYCQIENLIEDEAGAATMSHFLPRLFPTTPRIRYRNVIHENLALDANDKELPLAMSAIRIIHKGYTRAVLESKKKKDRNTPLLERAVREAAEDQFSWFNFGVAAIAAGDPAGIDALEKMFTLGDQPRAFYPVAYVQLASGYGDLRGDLDRALATLDEGLGVIPDHPNLLFCKGYFLSLSRRYDEARDVYGAAMAAKTSGYKHFLIDDEIVQWKAAFNLASTYIKEERHAEAIPWIERALAAKPNSSLLRGTLARTFERAGRVYDAERMFREAAGSDPVDGVPALVNYLMRRRRFTEALEIVDRRDGLVDDRSYVRLLTSAAAVTRDEKLGDYERYVRRGLAIAPGSGVLLAMLEDILTARADADACAAMRLAELDAPLVETGDYSRRSFRLLQEGRFAEAREVAGRGLEAAPSDGVLRYNAALASARLADDADARVHLDAIADSDNVKIPALTLRAEIERRCGDLDAAIAALESAAGLEQRDDALLRNAALGLTQELLTAGRLADAGRLAERVLA